MVVELVNPGHQGLRGRASSPMPMQSGLALPHCGEGGAGEAGQLSCYSVQRGADPAIPGPTQHGPLIPSGMVLTAP